MEISKDRSYNVPPQPETCLSDAERTQVNAGKSWALRPRNGIACTYVMGMGVFGGAAVVRLSDNGFSFSKLVPRLDSHAIEAHGSEMISRLYTWSGTIPPLTIFHPSCSYVQPKHDPPNAGEWNPQTLLCIPGSLCITSNARISSSERSIS